MSECSRHAAQRYTSSPYLERIYGATACNYFLMSFFNEILISLKPSQRTTLVKKKTKKHIYFIRSSRANKQDKLFSPFPFYPSSLSLILSFNLSFLLLFSLSISLWKRSTEESPEESVLKLISKSTRRKIRSWNWLGGVVCIWSSCRCCNFVCLLCFVCVCVYICQGLQLSSTQSDSNHVVSCSTDSQPIPAPHPFTTWNSTHHICYVLFCFFLLHVQERKIKGKTKKGELQISSKERHLVSIWTLVSSGSV